ncbi:UNVERIFIED_CONTAM: hypothetical protein FKN15_027381 [Acipenser sinensis]
MSQVFVTGTDCMVLPAAFTGGLRPDGPDTEPGPRLPHHPFLQGHGNFVGFIPGCICQGHLQCNGVGYSPYHY